MLRSSENWMVIEVDPSPLDDVMLSMPAMVENCFSSGVATAAAIVSGLAPGRFAFTWIVGKSTVGRSLTARRVYETAPKNRIPIMTSAVMTGLRINSAVIEVLPLSPLWNRGRAATGHRQSLARHPSAHSL